MATRNRIIAALAFVPFTFSMGAANAADYAFKSDCAGSFYALDKIIVEAQFRGKNATTDQSNLRVKLAGADVKLLEQKPGDATDKLVEIADKATTLADAAKPKLADAGAKAINDGASYAIQCVAGTVKAVQ
jgi:hypothetical protein